MKTKREAVQVEVHRLSGTRRSKIHVANEKENYLEYLKPIFI